MANLFSIGKSGLMAYQNAISVTGNNVANASTPGYSKQQTQFEALATKGRGEGIDVKAIVRSHDDFVNREIRNSISNYQKLATFYQYSSQLDTYLGSESTSISVGFDNFNEALHAVIDDPSSMTNRQMLINAMSDLSSRFNGLSDQIDLQYAQLKDNLSGSVSQVNELSKEIARLNNLLGVSTAENLQLLDQRDELLKELSTLLPISTIEDKNGAVDVYVGSGDVLVLGSKATELTMVEDAFDPRKNAMAIKSDYSTVLIRGGIDGGIIGGLLEYRDNMLAVSELDVNRLAVAFSDYINENHQQGINLQGNLGDFLLKDVNEPQFKANRVAVEKNNLGNLSMQIGIKDPNLLKTTEYTLTFTSATDYIINRVSDGTTASSGTLYGVPSTISLDGFDVEFTAGGASSGDRFLLRPLSTGSRNMKLNIKDPELLAFAAPIRAQRSNLNAGSAKLDFTKVTDINNPCFATVGQLAPPLRVEFLTGNSIQLVNATTSAVIEGPIAYNPRTGTDLFPTSGSFDPGYQLHLVGAGVAGDSFTVDYNYGAVGDSRNASEISGFYTGKLIGNSTRTVSEEYNRSINQVASKTHAIDVGRESAEAVMEQAQSHRDSIAGVNMDEEAADLMRFQQSYQASAQLISVADSLLNTLMDLLH